MCPTKLGLEEKPSSATLKNLFQCPLPFSFSFFVCLLFKVCEHRSIIPTYMLVNALHLANRNCNCYRPFIHPDCRKITPNALESQTFCWLEFSPWASALRLSAEEAPTDIAQCGEVGVHEGLVQSCLGLLGLGDFLACSPEIAFHLYKLWGIFLFFLQFLLLKFKLLQLLLPFQ